MKGTFICKALFIALISTLALPVVAMGTGRGSARTPAVAPAVRPALTRTPDRTAPAIPSAPAVAPAARQAVIATPPVSSPTVTTPIAIGDTPAGISVQTEKSVSEAARVLGKALWSELSGACNAAHIARPTMLRTVFPQP